MLPIWPYFYVTVLGHLRQVWSIYRIDVLIPVIVCGKEQWLAKNREILFKYICIFMSFYYKDCNIQL